MTFAGKKLQDIYDGGSKILAQMESTVSENLKTISEERTGKGSEGDPSGRFEQRSKEFQEELRVFMVRSIENVRRVMENEIRETEEHVKSLADELAFVAERLRNSISELKNSHDETIDHIKQSLSDHYESAVEESVLELEKEDHGSSKHLKAHGTFVMSSLQQKLDHSLWEARGDEKQFSGALFKAYMQRANTVDTHFSTLMGKMSTDFQSHYHDVETAAQEGYTELAAYASELAVDIDAYSVESENNAQEVFRNDCAEHSGTLEDSLRAVTTELSGLHDTTTEKLSTQTREMGSNLIKASGEAQEALKNRCRDVRTQIDTTMESFTKKLEERVSTNNALRQSLEGEKNAIFNDILRQLNETKATFEKKMSSLAHDALARVNSLTFEAEHEITAAKQSCADKLSAESATSRKMIEDSINNFLAVLSEHRKAALDEIGKSAGVAPAAEPENRPQERVRRTRRSREDSSLDQE